MVDDMVDDMVLIIMVVVDDAVEQHNDDTQCIVQTPHSKKDLEKIQHHHQICLAAVHTIHSHRRASSSP